MIVSAALAVATALKDCTNTSVDHRPRRADMPAPLLAHHRWPIDG
jgi:hypothetical protein